ncbi:MAG TPA: TrbI/VirB10 family protein [Vicinamibacterales bacterium]|nr:TrbI/VirB10 family protein [Vicinamibacterales bacterium]
MTDPHPASPTPQPPSSPPVIDVRRTPLGVMPRQLPRWLLLGIAVAMAAIMALSGAPTARRASSTSASTPVAVDANQQRIEDYQRRIQEQTERLVAEQQALDAAKTGAASRVEPHEPRPTRPATPPAVDAHLTTGPEPMARAAAPPSDRSLFVDSVAFTLPLASPSTPTAAASSAVPSTPPRDGSGAPDFSPADSHGAARVTSTPHTYTIPEGSVIETVLTNRLDGTFAGPVNCLVTTAVYAPDHQHLLIPAGARVLGDARPVTTFGQTRIAVVFHRVLLPNGARIDLETFHGLSQIGETGLRDEVDRHYAQIFGASLAVGAIAGLAQAQTSIGLDTTALDVYRQGAAANLAQSSARILDRFLNLLPTVTIREGHRIKVYVSSDLDVPAYVDDVTRLRPHTPGARP